ncbi:ABC transporter ATP-binding protein [Cryobacterium melibiosiphilum]|uniref:ABC transporter ATP-binding protein n=1 Tax=Cryobacterium melibiosiphilum TaxID=995039 RepID=A0A3A5MP58_9MICO|nr:ABC transporter ATP-binding protein [Cryobacterium melibiosiphilum]RJT91890.1 ABC transporter ATP-binding protein [Cryobacterium melibiosiphilum]
MIEFTRITKRYRGRTALDDVSFTVPSGSVTGFLGPNGAGKTTAMRILLGHARATSGTATVLGSRYAELHNPGRHVGSLLDAGAVHPGRTGRETLRLAARMMGVPIPHVDEVLDRVGLTRREGTTRVRGYSLGMRQRLGIAQALLGEPRVLVLDEPANGLDPQGIVWLRTLVRSLADDGCAVLLSSHLLHEVEQVADRIVMIGNGRVLAAGSTRELAAGHGLEHLYFQLTTPTDRSAA